MHPTPAASISLRIGYLDTLTAKGTFIQFYDPDGRSTLKWPHRSPLIWPHRE